VWRDIISIIVVHDDGRVRDVSVSWIRGLDESVFTGTKRGHGGVDYPQNKARQRVFKEQTAGMHVHCTVPALGTAIMSRGASRFRFFG
jgi:hypothetical protein